MRSHLVRLPPAAYDAMADGLGMMATSLFSNSVAENDIVRVECEDGRFFVGRVSGVAAVVERVMGVRDTEGDA